MKSEFLKYYILGILVFCSFSCKEYEIIKGETNTTVSKCNDGKYEIKLKYNRKGEGFSLHNLTWDKYDINEICWIYIDTLNGITKDSNIVISLFKVKDAHYFKSDRIYKGTINVDSTHINIDLVEPYYKDGKIQTWKKWELNGEYKYKEIKE